MIVTVSPGYGHRPACQDDRLKKPTKILHAFLVSRRNGYSATETEIAKLLGVDIKEAKEGLLRRGYLSRNKDGDKEMWHVSYFPHRDAEMDICHAALDNAPADDVDIGAKAASAFPNNYKPALPGTTSSIEACFPEEGDSTRLGDYPDMGLEPTLRRTPQLTRFAGYGGITSESTTVSGEVIQYEGQAISSVREVSEIPKGKFDKSRQLFFSTLTRPQKLAILEDPKGATLQQLVGLLHDVFVEGKGIEMPDEERKSLVRQIGQAATKFPLKVLVNYFDTADHVPPSLFGSLTLAARFSAVKEAQTQHAQQKGKTVLSSGDLKEVLEVMGGGIVAEES